MQLTVARSAGSLSGTVTTIPGDAPAPGVSVSVTSGATSLQTVTQSTGAVGGWTLAGLPIPGTYTVTFSRADLQSQTIAVTLDAAGNLGSGSGVSGNTITIAMTSAFAEISGVVSQRNADGSHPAGRRGGGGAHLGHRHLHRHQRVATGGRGRVVPGRRGEAGHLHAVRQPAAEPAPTTVIVTVVAGQHWPSTRC